MSQQLNLFASTIALEPFLVGQVCGFDPEGRWHDPSDHYLKQTRLHIQPGQLPRLEEPYVDYGRFVHAGNSSPAGPGWVENSGGHFVLARCMSDLIDTAEAAADVLMPPPYPWVTQQLRGIAYHWRKFSEPDWSTLSHWPGDAKPEALL